jgi:predicted NAD/FAD-dependent oxidoreductase
VAQVVDMTNANARIAVIGVAMAGTACARRLGETGIGMHLFGKSRRVGGRMPTRRIRWSDQAEVERDSEFDDAAPGFSVHSAAFAKRIHSFVRCGESIRWTSREAGGSFGPLDGLESGIPNPDMPELCRRLIGASPVAFGPTVDAIHQDAAVW